MSDAPIQRVVFAPVAGASQGDDEFTRVVLEAADRFGKSLGQSMTAGDNLQKLGGSLGVAFGKELGNQVWQPIFVLGLGTFAWYVLKDHLR